MDIRTTESRLADIPANRGFEFIFDLLAAYGIPKASISRLRKGDFNAAKADNELLWKNRVWFRFDESVDPHVAVDDASRDEQVAKARPRFLIAFNNENVVAGDRETGQTLDITFDELPRYVAFFWPWTGVERTIIETDKQADIKAAQRMAQLYDEIRTKNHVESAKQEQDLNVFFCRLLFCFFAEDTGIFEPHAFTEAVGSLTKADGTDFADFLREFFRVLDTDMSERNNVPQHFAKFPWVNGRLFSQPSEIPFFTARARAIVLECGDLHWAEISPDIFGSMMQAVVNTSHRRDVGMHYTSPTNIMKVLKPLFLDDLDSEYMAAQDNAKKLDVLRNRLGHIKVFDPACGSGNFLVLAYKMLRELENRILQRKLELLGYDAGVLVADETRISLDHFYGIEIDEFASEVARLSLWLAKHQMNQQFQELFGVQLPTVPLKDAGNIVCGNATRIEWTDVCAVGDSDEVYIASNPPYLGARRQSAEHKADMAYAFTEWELHRDLDYISAWFLKGAKFIRCRKAASLAFVTTNSVCQGQHVAGLWPGLLCDDIQISFAHEAFPWRNNAANVAGVSCIILGLRRKSSLPCRLISESSVRLVEAIAPSLRVVGAGAVLTKRDNAISKQLPQMRFGSMPGDGCNLILGAQDATELTRRYPNVTPFIRRFLGADDFVNGKTRYCLWFSNEPAPELAEIEEIDRRLTRVRNSRSRSPRKPTQSAANTSWRFLEVRHKNTSAIIVPRVTSERREYIPTGFVDKNTVIADSANAIYDAEPWLFGLIQSRMHNVWARAVAGRLKSDIRYSATLVYNTFPVPALTETHKASLTKAAMQVLKVRERYFDRTIAQIYDPDKMPDDLLKAHHALDAVVDGIYRSKPFASDDERLALLFEMYEDAITKESDEAAKSTNTARRNAKSPAATPTDQQDA